jgi:hypothetical protein
MTSRVGFGYRKGSTRDEVIGSFGYLETLMERIVGDNVELVLRRSFAFGFCSRDLVKSVSQLKLVLITEAR